MDRLQPLRLTEGFVRNQVRAGRWARWGDHPLLTHNFAPTRTQLMWLAVLDAGAPEFTNLRRAAERHPIERSATSSAT